MTIVNNYSVNVSGEALDGGTVETIIQVAASATRDIELLGWSISFNGVDSSAVPALVELYRPGSAGTSSVFTPVKLDPRTVAAQFQGRTSHTAEPSNGEIVEKHYVTPYGGHLHTQYAPDERIVVPANGRLGIRVLAPSAVAVSAFMHIAE